MKKELMGSVLALAAGVAFSAEITNVAVTQDAERHLVTVNYTLTDGPAIVTFDVSAEEKSIDATCLETADGKINRKLDSGSYSFTWRPETAWTCVTNRKDLAVQVKAWALDNPPPYMAMELFGAKSIRFYASRKALPAGETDARYKTHILLFRRVPAGNIAWTMGADGGTGNQTPHTVTLSSDYYIGVYPMTLAQCLLVRGNDYRDKISEAMGKGEIAKAYAYDYSAYGLMRPAVGLAYTWHLRGSQRDDSAYNWPNHKDVASNMVIGYLRTAFSGYLFDLPTNAQWEFACRGGVGRLFNNGTDDDCDSVGWYAANNTDDPDWVAGMPHAVGLKRPNTFGLYDCHGNVSEWVLDYYTANALADETDPEGPISTTHLGGNRVLRGGNFTDTSIAKLSASFHGQDNNLGGQQSIQVGFRLCLPTVIP